MAALTDAQLADLRANLAYPLQAWQGSHFPQVEQYARAWQQTSDVAFFGKAVAGLRTVENYQKDAFDGYEIVGRGDGAATAFPLRAGSMGNYGGGIIVVVSPRATQAVTRGPGDTDEVTYYADFHRVYDGAGDYAFGTDWTRSADDGNNSLRWLPGGRRPAAGASYSVDYTSRFGALSRLTPANDSVTLPAAPAAGSAVYAAYCYSPPGGLPYQETVGGFGGFNLVYVDDSFAVKFLDSLVRAFMIVKDDPRFPADLKAELLSLLPRWFDYVTVHGYMRDSLQSNYGVGGESFRVNCAYALNDGPRIQQVQDFWTTHVPQIVGPAPSLKGGFWAEGPNYGNLSIRKLLDLATLHELHGVDISPVRAWAAEVALYLAHASPGTSWRNIVAFGDNFAQPPLPTPFPMEDRDYLAAFGTPVPAVRDGLPTDYVAPGTGCFHSRTDWMADGMLASVLCGPRLIADHQDVPGQVQIELGETPALLNGAVLLDDQTGPPKSKHSNVLLIDGNQTYPPGMGYWYTGLNFVTSYTPGPDRTTWRLYPGAAFSPNTAPDTGGPCQFWGRDVTFLKGAKALVVYDRVGLRGDYPWRVQWCLPAQADADGWYKATAGTRTLYVTALSSDGPVTPTVSADGKFLTYALATPARQGRIVTVFAADRKPAVALSGGTVTIDAEAVTLDQTWPPNLPDLPPAPPPPPPGPPPGPPPNPWPGPVNWQGTYGKTAFAVATGPQTAAFLTTAAKTYQWPGLVAAAWYGDTVTANVAATAGVLSLYLIDPDHARTQQVQVVAADGTALLDRRVSAFGDGLYLTCPVAGPVTVRVTKVVGDNAVLSAVFLDPPPAPPAPVWVEVGRFESGDYATVLLHKGA